MVPVVVELGSESKCHMDVLANARVEERTEAGTETDMQINILDAPVLTLEAQILENVLVHGVDVNFLLNLFWQSPLLLNRSVSLCMPIPKQSGNMLDPDSNQHFKFFMFILCSSYHLCLFCNCKMYGG